MQKGHMIGLILIGTLLGWLAAAATLVSGAGLAMALGALVLTGMGATLLAAALSCLPCPLRAAASA